MSAGCSLMGSSSLPMKRLMHLMHPVRACAITVAISFLHASAASAAENKLTGDLGAGASWSESQIHGARDRTDAVPYLNLEYGPAFARIDTFGMKVLPMAYGHVEIVGQYRSDGYEAEGLDVRRDPVPFGVGTLQITPIGAFNLNVFHDFGKSSGTLLQARYLAEIQLGRVTVYPEVGVEYQSSDYTRYYFAPTQAEAARLGRSYQPGSAVNLFAGALIETRITERWYAHLYVRHTVVDEAIADSPLVSQKGRSSALLAAAYRF